MQSGGHLHVVKSLEIAGHWDTTDSASASLKMTGGTITGTNSIQLQVDYGFLMNGGTFTTTHDGVTNSDYTFILTGNMKVAGTGVVDLYQDSVGLHLGALSVIGNVDFEGGTYKAKIVGTATSTERNRWISSGTFTTDAYATITPIVTSTALGTSDPNNPRYWNVISATNGISADALLPTIPAEYGRRTRLNRTEYDLQW